MMSNSPLNPAPETEPSKLISENPIYALPECSETCLAPQVPHGIKHQLTHSFGFRVSGLLSFRDLEGLGFGGGGGLRAFCFRVSEGSDFDYSFSSLPSREA